MREREKKWWLSVSQIIQYCYDEYWIKSLCLFLQPLPSDILTRRVGILEVGVLPINSFRPFDQSTATATTKPEFVFLYIGRFQFRLFRHPYHVSVQCNIIARCSYNASPVLTFQKIFPRSGTHNTGIQSEERFEKH